MPALQGFPEAVVAAYRATRDGLELTQHASTRVHAVQSSESIPRPDISPALSTATITSARAW